MKRTMQALMLLAVGIGVAAPAVAYSRYSVDAPGMFAIGNQVFEGERIQLSEYPSSFVAVSVDGRRIAMLSLDACSSSTGALTLRFSRDGTGLYRLHTLRRGADRCKRAPEHMPLSIASLEEGVTTVAEYRASRRATMLIASRRQETP